MCDAVEPLGRGVSVPLCTQLLVLPHSLKVGFVLGRVLCLTDVHLQQEMYLLYRWNKKGHWLFNFRSYQKINNENVNFNSMLKIVISF